MQIISSQVPYVGKSRNAEHDYLFNKLVEAISKEFATKHNFLAYHQRTPIRWCRKTTRATTSSAA